jgi:hypothetical protein
MIGRLARSALRRSLVFADVIEVGLTLPGVDTATRYDGTAILRRGGAFMAGVATHVSAEPGTLVVRTTEDECRALIDEAPATYYVTAYYRAHGVVLVRLANLDREALRDLLTTSWRLTGAKARPRSRGTLPAW